MPSKKTRTLIGAILIAVCGFLTITTPLFAASKEQVLYSFCSANDCTDGEMPYGGLVFDDGGNLYGTAGGGINGKGVIFELTRRADGGWTDKVLYNFCSLQGCADGSGPAWSSLVFDSEGNLYGTTTSGGAYQSDCGRLACGTVFELSPKGDGTWTETVLHSFGNGEDGRQPLAGVILDQTGNLYGTTFEGGSHGSGTAFELTPGNEGTPWTEAILHNFCSAPACKDGAAPEAPLILDPSGNLYGTTNLGAHGGCGHQGCGGVFELIPGAGGKWKEKTLHSFNSDDGRQPQAGLIFDSAGNLYGTTFAGGPHGTGTVFELSLNKKRAWTERVLASNGIGSTASLVFDSSGNLYGTSESGGNGAGAVFKLIPSKAGKWSLKTLYKFSTNGLHGDGPSANLIFDATGNLYSTTTAGGSSGSGCGGYGCGTVFEITP